MLHAAHRLAIKGFHLDNDLWFQYAANTTAIRLPQFVSRRSIYYERRFFKGALWWMAGFDLRSNTPFYANSYFPFTGQFVIQNEASLQYYPVLDFFMNFRFRTVRVFLLK